MDMRLYFFILSTLYAVLANGTTEEVGGEPKTLEDIGPPQQIPQMCPTSSDGEETPYFEDPYDCNCYYVCDKWRRPMRMCCPQDLWWHPLARTCTYRAKFSQKRRHECSERKKAALKALDQGSYTYIPMWLKEKLKRHREVTKIKDEKVKKDQEPKEQREDVEEKIPDEKKTLVKTTPVPPEIQNDLPTSKPNRNGIQILEIPNFIGDNGLSVDMSLEQEPHPVLEKKAMNSFARQGPPDVESQGIYLNEDVKNSVHRFELPTAEDKNLVPDQPHKITISFNFPDEEDIIVTENEDEKSAANAPIFQTHPANQPLPPWVSARHQPKVASSGGGYRQSQHNIPLAKQRSSAGQRPPQERQNSRGNYRQNLEKPMTLIKEEYPTKMAPFASSSRASLPFPAFTHQPSYIDHKAKQAPEVQQKQHSRQSHPTRNNFLANMVKAQRSDSAVKSKPQLQRNKFTTNLNGQQQIQSQAGIFKRQQNLVSYPEDFRSQRQGYQNQISSGAKTSLSTTRQGQIPRSPTYATANTFNNQVTQSREPRNRKSQPSTWPGQQQQRPQFYPGPPQKTQIQYKPEYKEQPAEQSQNMMRVSNQPIRTQVLNQPSQRMQTQKASPVKPPQIVQPVQLQHRQTVHIHNANQQPQFTNRPRSSSLPAAEPTVPATWPVPDGVTLEDVVNLEKSYANYYNNEGSIGYQGRTYGPTSDTVGPADNAEDIHGGAEDDARLEAAVNEVKNIQEKSGDENDEALSLDRYYANLPDDFIYGHCSVQPNPAQQNLTDFLWGSIDLRQSLKGGPTEIRIEITGFDSSNNHTLHGFHVHEFGDLSSGCESAGGHYDPFGVVHGGPEDDPRFRHFGDLGNVNEANGEVVQMKKDYLVSLLGPFSVLGRAIVIHEKEDDMGRGQDEGSLLSGNAGIRLGCCTIGLSNGERWQDKAWDARWQLLEQKQAAQEAEQFNYNSKDDYAADVTNDVTNDI